jgi:hypothetical protein
MRRPVTLNVRSQFTHVGALIVLLVLFEGTVFFLYERGIIKIDNKVEFVGLFTIAGFAVVIFQLWQSYVVQRAKFLTDYLTKIYTDPELSATFHDLVQSYTDDIFDSIDLIVEEKNGKKIRETTKAPVFDIFDSLQGPRKDNPGKRFYHPECFQGSEEERRLDSFIGYMDIVGYHYYYGILRMKDVAALINYHLASLSSRKVISKYMRLSGSDWWNSTNIKAGSKSVQLPYLYFRNMLAEYIEYNETNRVRLEREQRKIERRNKSRFL